MTHKHLKKLVEATYIPELAEDITEEDIKINPKNPNFSIEELEDYYKINGISYRNGMYSVDLSKTLQPQGTQEEHANNRIQALENNTFYTPDYPLFHNIINTLYQNKEGEFQEQIEQTRTFLKELISGKGLMTLTRIKYATKGKDTIIHNYNQKDQYEIQTNFIGPDGDITKQETKAEKPIQSLLNTKQTPEEISNIYKWFRDLPVYIWRVNSTPKSVDERVARFDAGSDGSYLYCDWGPQGSGSSAGVRANFLGDIKNDT